MQQSQEVNQYDAAATTECSVSLMQSLRDAGYRPDKVRLHVILLDVGGTVYNSMHRTLLLQKQLGVNRQGTVTITVKTVAGKLHKHATVYENHANQMSQEFVVKRDTG
jgi:hypothetical protein